MFVYIFRPRKRGKKCNTPTRGATRRLRRQMSQESRPRSCTGPEKIRSAKTFKPFKSTTRRWLPLSSRLRPRPPTEAEMPNRKIGVVVAKKRFRQNLDRHHDLHFPIGSALKDLPARHHRAHPRRGRCHRLQDSPRPPWPTTARLPTRPRPLVINNSNSSSSGTRGCCNSPTSNANPKTSTFWRLSSTSWPRVREIARGGHNRCSVKTAGMAVRKMARFSQDNHSLLPWSRTTTTAAMRTTSLPIPFAMARFRSTILSQGRCVSSNRERDLVGLCRQLRTTTGVATQCEELRRCSATIPLPASEADLRLCPTSCRNSRPEAVLRECLELTRRRSREA